LQALADQLRKSHEVVLAEVEKQVRAMKEPQSAAEPNQTATTAGGDRKPEGNAEQEAAQASPPARYIDPHLGEKLRGLLFAALEGQGGGQPASQPGHTFGQIGPRR
jgi:hypothetical protein